METPRNKKSVGGVILACLAALVGVDSLGGQERLPGFTQSETPPRLLNVEEVRSAVDEYYVSELQPAGVTGSVWLWMHVATDGTVDSTEVAESSGEAALAAAARAIALTMARGSPPSTRSIHI